jgi:serine/threonine protein kinase/Flp pilus assembly protein TadD
VALLSGDPLWFGQYRLTSRIATGGMAEVYVGRHVDANGRMGPMVAVKRLLPHLLSQPFIVQMFLNEARITAQIHHPNVVEVLDLGHENGEPFIVMELLEGRPFADLRQRAAEQGRHVPLGTFLRVLSEACRGLDAAHRAMDDKGRQLCIVHRDFTPDNIHVGVDGSVKVIDFGIAKAEHLSAGTEPGTLKGKFFYMSPEMIAGKQVDHRADIFAAGVMLYEQLCGRRPFTGNSPDEVVQRISQGQQRKPTEFDPSVPPALELVCMTALASQPERRYASMFEFIQAIEAVGGIAQLSSLREVGAYVNEQFPLDKDPKRQTLRRARQADPSNVMVRLGEEPLPQHEEDPAEPARGPAATESEPSETQIPLLARSRLPVKWFAIGAGSAVLIGVLIAVVSAWPKWFPPKSLAARLDEAVELKEASTREKALRELASDPMATVPQLKRIGQLLLQQSAHESALVVAERYATRFPTDEAARLMEARACMGLRQGKRAEVAIEKAAALAPADPQPDLTLADLREMQGDYSGALESLAKAAKKQPSRQLTARRGYLLSQSGRLDEASDTLGQLLAKRFDPDAAAELAFVRYRQNQLPEAISLLKKALKESPRLAKAHYYLGAVLYRGGDIQAAEKEYRAADEMGLDDPRALLALCQVEQASGEAKEADETRKLIDQRFPKDAAELKAQCKT